MKTKNQLAVMVPVIESERGWGQKIDDHMVCLTNEDAGNFSKEFNGKNKPGPTPDWYMYAVNNNGSWYDFGFVLGFGILFNEFRNNNN